MVFRRIIEFTDQVNSTFSKLSKSVFGEYKLPSTEMTQGTHYFTVQLKFLNIEKKEIKLAINKKHLEVKVEHKKNRKGVVLEVGYYRSISLPPDLDVSTAQAEFIKDTLTIKIPKKRTVHLTLK